VNFSELEWDEVNFGDLWGIEGEFEGLGSNCNVGFLILGVGSCKLALVVDVYWWSDGDG